MFRRFQNLAFYEVPACYALTSKMEMSFIMLWNASTSQKCVITFQEKYFKNRSSSIEKKNNPFHVTSTTACRVSSEAPIH